MRTKIYIKAPNKQTHKNKITAQHGRICDQHVGQRYLDTTSTSSSPYNDRVAAVGTTNIWDVGMGDRGPTDIELEEPCSENRSSSSPSPYNDLIVVNIDIEGTNIWDVVEVIDSYCWNPGVVITISVTAWIEGEDITINRCRRWWNWDDELKKWWTWQLC